MTSLLAQGRKLFVGTLSGLVAVFDSQSFGLIARYSWHEGKVRSLLHLPEQVKTCICAEVPLMEEYQTRTSAGSGKSTHHDVCLIASIGNGRVKYGNEEKKDLENSIGQSRRFTWMTRNHEDINLLLWHS